MGHTYGTITDTVDIIRTHKKGKHLKDIRKKSHIYIYTKSVKLTCE
jgi:hypothetical protein